MGFIYYRVVNLSQRLKISGEFLLGFDDDPLPEPVYCIFERMVVVDDKFGRLRWGLGGGVGHHIGDGLIFLVPDAGDDGNWEFGDRLADHIIVKDEEV